MKRMSRSNFIKLSVLGVAGTAHSNTLFRLGSGMSPKGQDDALLKRVIESSDRAVANYSNTLRAAEQRRYFRPFSDAFAAYTASYCHPESSHYQSTEVLEKMDAALTTLIDQQYPNGTLDSGGNRQSPPDTAFYLEKMCPAAVVLKRAALQKAEAVQEKLHAFLAHAGESVRTGGVHTPNHRWVVTAVLAQLFALFEDEKYLVRLEEWLAEGIYQNEDGNYPERSRNYSIVENNAFITIGRILNRPEFFEIARRNLESNYFYMEPNGDLITLDSRRQDQNYTIEMARFYFQYSYLAHHFQDPFFAAIAKEIEEFNGFDRHVLSKLIFFMEEPILLTDLPSPQPLPTNYTKSFPGSALVRIRREHITASIFGGNDKPIHIASGRSNNPTFFTFRKGQAILHSVRLSTGFFNTGYVRPDSIEKEGNQYTLKERKEAYYYHPMTPDKRNAEGDYTLSPSLDGRFWSKMDFANRAKDTLTLESKIIIIEDNGSFRLDIEVEGPEEVAVTVEFCFDTNGGLEGVEQAANNTDYFLKTGAATYTSGTDTITIGPGKHEHSRLRGLDGEMYSTHFGTIKGQGKHVYLTGYTPFRHSFVVS